MAKKKSFTFRPGSRVKGVDAEDAGRELARIRRKHGALTPAVTVEEASDEENPLHDAFEWDDATAAHEHRLGQARSLIRAVCVVYDADEPAQSVYVHVTGEEGGEYQPIEVVAKCPELSEIALEELRAKLAGAQRAVNELLGVIRAQGRDATRLEVIAEHLELANEEARLIA
jgi:hypothetical protein